MEVNTVPRATALSVASVEVQYVYCDGDFIFLLFFLNLNPGIQV